MPKIINNFTIHIQDPDIGPNEMEEYLIKRFGPSRSDVNDSRNWYMGRNYQRPYNESHLEIQFEGSPTSKHTLMMLEHPFTIINEDVTEWAEVDDKVFNKLFEGIE